MRAIGEFVGLETSRKELAWRELGYGKAGKFMEMMLLGNTSKAMGYMLEGKEI